jgi:hypothetical protein
VYINNVDIRICKIIEDNIDHIILKLQGNEI